MSHSVHYILPRTCLESEQLVESPLLSEAARAELKRPDFPVESELHIGDDRALVTFSTEFGLGVLWTNVNYSRFLYANERVRTVESLDKWIRTWCPVVVRADEFFVDKWFAELEASGSDRTASTADFVRWLRTANPEQTHWIVLGEGSYVDP